MQNYKFGNELERREQTATLDKLSRTTIDGYFTQPAGPHGLGHKTPYYKLRYNHNKSFMSDKEFGLQALINAYGELVWINIENSWLN